MDDEANRHGQGGPAADQDDLPLEAWVGPDAGGWIVRLPLRAELIQLDKTVAVYERIVVRRETERVEQSLTGVTRREELRIKPQGKVVMDDEPNIDTGIARTRAHPGEQSSL